MKKILLFINCLFLLLSGIGHAQINKENNLENISYERPIEYTIGGIEVNGTQNLDKNAIVTLSGLSAGNKIMVPGEDISKAVTNLWDQNLFSDIQIDVSQIKENSIFLVIRLQELPKLSKFTFTGISKSETDNLRDKIDLIRGEIVTENLVNNTKNIIQKFFEDKGYLNTRVNIGETFDSTLVSGIILDINIRKGEKVKINNINIPKKKSLLEYSKAPNSFKNLSKQTSTRLLTFTKRRGTEMRES